MTMTPDMLFAALAHPLRVRAAILIYREGELCVCELTHALGVSQPMISRHLAQLRQLGLVSDRRQGLWVYYTLHEDLPAWTRQVLAAIAEGAGESGPYAADRATLAAMANRPGAACCA